MGRNRKNPPEEFGERLREIRKFKGFTQGELADAIDSSQRMIAYYEAQGGNITIDIITRLAEVLEVSIDEFIEPPSPAAKPKVPPATLRLRRQLKRVETLPSKDRKSVIQFIDALVEKEQLKKKR